MRYSKTAIGIAALFALATLAVGVATLGSSAWPPQVPASGTLTRDDLTEYGYKAMRRAGTDTKELIGREFSIEWPAIYDYDLGGNGELVGDKELEFSADPKFWNASEFDPEQPVWKADMSDLNYVYGFRLDDNIAGSRVGSSVWQNDFGAKRTMAIYKSKEVALVQFKKSRTGGNNGLPPNGAENGDDTVYKVKLTVGPAAAQQLMGNVDFVVSGVVAEFPNGQAVACGEDKDPRTNYKPQSTDTTSCAIGADVRRVAFVNKATGAILAEWKQPSANAAAK